MEGACRRYGRDDKFIDFRRKIRKYHLEDIGVGERIILKRILKGQGGGFGLGSSGLNEMTSGGLLLTR
jgi:hypothetical protein